MKSIHAMVMDFTQHPAGIINIGNIGVMQHKLPRLKKVDASTLEIEMREFTLRSIKIEFS